MAMARPFSSTAINGSLLPAFESKVSVIPVRPHVDQSRLESYLFVFIWPSSAQMKKMFPPGSTARCGSEAFQAPDRVKVSPSQLGQEEPETKRRASISLAAVSSQTAKVFPSGSRAILGVAPFAEEMSVCVVQDPVKRLA
jgi:hypothetical protein